MTIPRNFDLDPKDEQNGSTDAQIADSGEKKNNGNTRRNRTRRWLLLSLFLIPIIISVVYALNQDDGILWLFQNKTDFPEVDLKDDIATILAPLTALALAIERIIETIFDLIEQSAGSMARLIGESKDAVSWVEEEYANASNQVKNGVKSLGRLRGDEPDTPPADEDKIKAAENKLKQAEQRLAKAGERLTNLAADPIYVQMKRALSIMIGLFLGFLVAIFSDQGVFAYLQQGVPRVVDIFITGFIIGAGSGPMHSLIGIL
ncbi:MAG TPA: hypothetical protein VJ965_08275, partial [Anaerolineales bacterium]|nr:hypothetical protein [Anaerolineales bacterium]